MEHASEKLEAQMDAQFKSSCEAQQMSIVSANPVTLAIQRHYDEIRAASYAARTSLDHFIAALQYPEPNRTGFRVKVFFPHRRTVEHIWLKDLEVSGEVLTGTAAKQSWPFTRASAERRSFTRDRITDWMYIEGGETVGAYTAGVLQRQQREQRRSGLKRMLGLGLIS